MPFWIKTNGIVMATNDRPETIEHCESLGWELTDITQEGPIVNADKGSGIPGTEEWHT